MRTAIIYDFDGTLARGYMQNVSLIPNFLGINPPRVFWDEVKNIKQAQDADEILTYQRLLITKAREKGTALTRDILRTHGANPEFFDGLANKDWFTRINAVAKSYGLDAEHYVVSSGLYEMIQGCGIADAFKHVFASNYAFGDNGEALTPSVAINYTTKTQYLFRINKGIENNWDDKALNAYLKLSKRPIPFERMIFLGDGDTDIPTMKMMHAQGGYSIGVYDPASSAAELKRVHRLISDDRVNFVAAGDYTDGSALDIIVKGILGRIALTQSELDDLPA